MLSTKLTIGIAITIAACLTTHVEAQQWAAKPITLTALDIHEIQQLSARYTHAIDTCADTGYQYADLYAPDGVFIDMWSEDAVKTGGVKWQGRERLREIASGANVTGAPCTSSRFNGSITHMILSLVITPTADGATGHSCMVELGGRDPNKITRMGNYEDVYVKTANGWRFKTRTHSRAPNGQLPAPPK